MEVQIIVEYRTESYESQIFEVNEKELTELKTLIMGELQSFQIDTGESTIYFPQKVLDESIITLFRIEKLT